jgi:flavin reductase (DIM6/NTAB) family NADH-FMN oxidoreductase RutF/2-polyprenyl-6-methoxyphenol hydroxylase-like FAD-dependent oxidoreductase
LIAQARRSTFNWRAGEAIYLRRGRWRRRGIEGEHLGSRAEETPGSQRPGRLTADAAETLTDASVTAEEFKAAMRMLPSGVVIVTSEIDGRPWGLTVSACCAISPFPPKLLVSLGRQTRSRQVILASGRFGVNILQASQHVLAEVCAAPGEEKWIDEFCAGRAEGMQAPLVANSLCHLDCAIDSVTEVSDHSLIIGRIEASRIADENENGPLLYFDRAFRTLGGRLERPKASAHGRGRERVPGARVRGHGRAVSRRIVIIGAGQAGLQVAFGLLEHGHHVTVLSDRTPEQVLDGRAPPTAAMFDRALSHERELGLNLWDRDAAWFEGIHLDLCERPGEVALSAEGALEAPGQAIDQRLKFATWMGELERRGGTLRVHEASVSDLEELAGDADLVLVATGRGELGALFDHDEERTIYDRPQRLLCLFVLHGVCPWDEIPFAWPIKFTFVAGHGEIFWIPFLDKGRVRCRSVLFEARRGAGFDRFHDARDGEEALEAARSVIAEFCPWESATIADAQLPEPKAWARGGLTPVVRRPIGHLPSGRVVMAVGDTAILNDPLAGQGANCASKMAHFVTERIVDRGDRPFDADWMEECFEDFWDREGRYITGFTNTLLEPLGPAAREVILAGSRRRSVAERLFAGFDDPPVLWPWIEDRGQARRVVADATSSPWLATAVPARLAVMRDRLRQRLGGPPETPPAYRGS